MSSNTNRATGPLTFSKSSQDPHKKSQIIAAVQNHFSISSPSETSHLNVDSKSAGKRPPLIGKYCIYWSFANKKYPIFKGILQVRLEIKPISKFFSPKSKNKRCSSKRNHRKNQSFLSEITHNIDYWACK